MAITITNDSAMLNVNSMSSTSGGNDRTNMASTASTPTGTPMPVRISSRRGGSESVADAVAMSMLDRIDRRIDIRRCGWMHAVAACAAQLVDVSQHLRDGDIQRCRDLAADLNALEQRAGQRWRLEDRYQMFGCDLANARGHEISALGDHEGGAHAGLVIT